MSTKKRFLALILAVLLILSLAGCETARGDTVDIPASQTGDTDFQKNMHQSTTYEIDAIAETDAGYYFELDGSYLYFLDKETKKVTIVCNKPECQHEDATCNARIAGEVIWSAGDKLYYTCRNSVLENGQYVDYGLRVYRMDMDGTNREAIQKLQFVVRGDTVSWTPHPIQHRGIVYFPYSGVLYRMPLGGDIEKDAEAIWGEASEDTGMFFNTSAPAYHLWADGDTVYFMVGLETKDGIYKDVLFAYDPEAKKVEQVWQTPDKEDVGEWITTGVEESQWYILNGSIYFYLSGGDFWKTDLSTGKTEKLADTHEKTKYGSAVFSDDYLCLMNDVPEDVDGMQYSIVGGLDYIGGDTLYIYKLDGSFVKEISLQPVYDSIDGLEHCMLVMCDGSEVYFVADASKWGQRVEGVAGKIWDQTLWCANIETGEVTQIFRMA